LRNRFFRKELAYLYLDGFSLKVLKEKEGVIRQAV
jgi:transposase-like protein